MKYLRPLALALILVLGGCDSNGSDLENDGNDLENDGNDGDGNGDPAGERSFLIQIEAENEGAAGVAYSYECYDADGDATGASGSGTISTSAGSFSTNMCSGFGIAVDATYDEGAAPIDVRVLAGPVGGNEEDVVAEKTLPGEGEMATIRLGSAPVG